MLIKNEDATSAADYSSDATTSTDRKTPSRSPSPSDSAEKGLKARAVKVTLNCHAPGKADPHRVNCIEYGKILATEHGLLLLTPSMSHHQAVAKLLVAMDGRGIYDEDKPGIHFDSLEMIDGCESIVVQVSNWKAAVMMLLNNDATTLRYSVAIATPDWDWVREIQKDRRQARTRRKLGAKTAERTASSTRGRRAPSIGMIVLFFWLLGTAIIRMIVLP